MKTFIIPQKESGTGTIHDIASEHYDREIKFRKGEIYALVLAMYYGGCCYKVRSEEAIIKVARKNAGYSYKILDAEGNTYSINYWNELIKD